jgi:hypothetical protein
MRIIISMIQFHLVHYNNNNDVCGISQRNRRLLVNLVKGF